MKDHESYLNLSILYQDGRQALRLERLYRRTKSATDRENWVLFVRRMHALQGKRVRVLGSKDSPSCKRSEAPLGYLQRSIRLSRGWFALKESRILRQEFHGVLREQ